MAELTQLVDIKKTQKAASEQRKETKQKNYYILYLPLISLLKFNTPNFNKCQSSTLLIYRNKTDTFIFLMIKYN